MKKAAEKSAVRWSCAVLAVLFFFLAASALTLRRMQQNYGCPADDTAGREALVSGLFDDNVRELSQALRPYFESAGTVRIACPPQFRAENTNFRFCVWDADGNVILNTISGEEASYRQMKTVDVEFSAESEDRLLRTETVAIRCELCAQMQADDVFRRALTLVRLGTSIEDALWSLCVVFSAAALFLSAVSLRGALREAKRAKGAERLFNALPPDLYVCCVLPALVFFLKLLHSGIRDREIIQNYLRTGSGEYRFLLRPACMAGLFALALLFLMLLVFSIRRGGVRGVFSIVRFVAMPFPRRMLVYLVVMQVVKSFAIVLYLTSYTNWVVTFLLLEKLVTLPVVYRMLRQLRTLMDATAQFVQGDLSGKAMCENDYATLRMHGADVDSIVRRISDSADEYVQSSRFKAELITNLSHDIKTPLTSIISYAQLLERDDLPESERKQYIEVLQRQSGKLRKLVEDLTEVSDAVSGNVSVQTTVLDLCSFVQQAASGFEQRLQKQDVSIRFCLPEEPVFVSADARLMQRVTDNLMNNICKYTRSGTEVQIAVVDGEGSVAAVFRNRSAQPLTLSGEALMERFVREDGSRHTEGSGLGLSIAQSLMRLQGGKLWLHTEDDVFTAQILFRKS